MFVWIMYNVYLLQYLIDFYKCFSCFYQKCSADVGKKESITMINNSYIQQQFCPKIWSVQSRSSAFSPSQANKYGISDITILYMQNMSYWVNSDKAIISELYSLFCFKAIAGQWTNCEHWPHNLQLPTILLIFIFLDPNFAKGHKIGTLGSRDLILFLKWPSLIGGLS